MDGWNTTFLLGRPIFRGYVSFREGIWRVPAFVPMNVWLPKSVLAGTPIPWNQQTSIGFSLVDSRPISSSWDGPRRWPCCRYFGRIFCCEDWSFFFAVWTCLSQIHAQISISAETNWEDKQPSVPASAKEQHIDGIRTTWPSYDSGNGMVMLATFFWILCSRPKRIST